MASVARSIDQHSFRATLRFFGAVACTILVGSLAHAEPSINLLDLQVFAKGSIQASSSDYQGPTAAGSDIDLVDFSIDGNLTSGRRISVLRGSVSGVVSSPSKDLSQVSSAGSGPPPKVALDLAATKLERLSAKMAALPVTTRIGVSEDKRSGTLWRLLTVVAKRNLEIVELPGDQLRSYGPGQVTIHLEGDERSRLLVRITGPTVRIHDVAFAISGGLDPSNVTFFFPQATDLDISDSGGALSREGRSIGVPGSVIAPNASLHFGSALITGQVFVRDILPIPGSPSGQIDKLAVPRTDAPEARAEFVSSQILQLMDADQAWRCAKQ